MNSSRLHVIMMFMRSDYRLRLLTNTLRSRFRRRIYALLSGITHKIAIRVLRPPSCQNRAVRCAVDVEAWAVIVVYRVLCKVHVMFDVVGLGFCQSRRILCKSGSDKVYPLQPSNFRSLLLT